MAKKRRREVLKTMMDPPGDDEDIMTSNVRMRRGNWNELEFIAAHASELWARAGKPKKFSRNDIATNFLEWAIQQYWKEKGPRPDRMPEGKSKKGKRTRNG